eukprot:scaffold34_cov124-Isochrysis_galbana.AAC.15
MSRAPRGVGRVRIDHMNLNFGMLVVLDVSQRTLRHEWCALALLPVLERSRPFSDMSDLGGCIHMKRALITVKQSRQGIETRRPPPAAPAPALQMADARDAVAVAGNEQATESSFRTATASSGGGRTARLLEPPLLVDADTSTISVGLTSNKEGALTGGPATALPLFQRAHVVLQLYAIEGWPCA